MSLGWPGKSWRRCQGWGKSGRFFSGCCPRDPAQEEDGWVKGQRPAHFIRWLWFKMSSHTQITKLRKWLTSRHSVRQTRSTRTLLVCLRSRYVFVYRGGGRSLVGNASCLGRDAADICSCVWPWICTVCDWLQYRHLQTLFFWPAACKHCVKINSVS